MCDEYSGQIHVIDGLPNAPGDSLSIVSTIPSEKISKIDKLINISDEIELTSEEEVKHSFPNIFNALISSQSPVKIPELTANLNRDEWRIAKRLRVIGDKVDRIFGSEIGNLLGGFPSTYTPLEILSKIFFGVFEDGQFSWGRIIVFISFGVKLFLRSISKSLSELVKKLCSEIVTALGTIFAEGAFEWIANHGGWKRIVASNRLAMFIRKSTPWCPLGLGTTAGIFFLVLIFRLWRSKV